MPWWLLPRIAFQGLRPAHQHSLQFVSHALPCHLRALKTWNHIAKRLAVGRSLPMPEADCVCTGNVSKSLVVVRLQLEKRAQYLRLVIRTNSSSELSRLELSFGAWIADILHRIKQRTLTGLVRANDRDDAGGQIKRGLTLEATVPLEPQSNHPHRWLTLHRHSDDRGLRSNRTTAHAPLQEIGEIIEVTRVSQSELAAP